MTSPANVPDNSLLERAVSWTMLLLAVGLGGASLVAFGVFLYAGPFGVVDLNLVLPGVLAIDTGLSLLFFVQHSWMVRASSKRWLARTVPEHYLSAIYAIASGVGLFAVVLLWQDSGHVIWQAEGGLWWIARVVFLLALAIGTWGALSLRGFDSFGVRPIRRRSETRAPRPPVLVVQGAYRWVRHPLYFVVLLMIWSYPMLTADRLLFNVLWSVWIIIGAVLEERDLCKEFGNDYREYQRNVPMLLPVKIPSR